MFPGSFPVSSWPLVASRLLGESSAYRCHPPPPRPPHVILTQCLSSHRCLLIRVSDMLDWGPTLLQQASFISTNYIDTNYASIYCHPVQCLSLRLPLTCFGGRRRGTTSQLMKHALQCLPLTSVPTVPLATQSLLK